MKEGDVLSFDFTTLITDRTQADVDALAALTKKEPWTAEDYESWFHGFPEANAVYTKTDQVFTQTDPVYTYVPSDGRIRGAYNHTDLNRVGEALRALSGLFAGYGYHVSVTARTDWTAEEWPTPEALEALLADLRAVRGVLDMPEGTPAVPQRLTASGLNQTDGLTVEKANDMERLLLYVEMVIQWVAAAFSRANAFTFWSGSRPLPSAKSDRGRTWAELDAMGTTWRNWQVATWYLLLYGNLKAEGDVV